MAWESQETVKLITALFYAYRQEARERTMKIYISVFAATDPDILRIALRRLLLSLKFLPSIAEINSAVEQVIQEEHWAVIRANRIKELQSHHGETEEEKNEREYKNACKFVWSKKDD